MGLQLDHTNIITKYKGVWPSLLRLCCLDAKRDSHRENVLMLTIEEEYYYLVEEYPRLLLEHASSMDTKEQAQILRNNPTCWSGAVGSSHPCKLER